MTKKIIWRLKEQPTAEVLRDLVKDKLLTNDEAREILFSHEETEKEKQPKVKELEAEIVFLRSLVEKLAKSPTQIVEIIKEVAVPYRAAPWYPPYYVWCTNAAGTQTYTLGNTATAGLLMSNAQNTSALNGGSTGLVSFSNIKTF